MSEYKPNTGKAWATKAEKKQKEMERLMEFDWFQGLSEDEKMMKIPLYSGTLNKLSIPPGQDCQIEICKEVSRSGQPQLALRVYQTDEQKGLAASTPPPAAQPASDPFGEDPFGI